MQAGDLLELDVTKPAAGGRMLARHNGQVVLVWGAIPGERVRARIDRVGKGVAFGDTVEVLVASPDRRDAAADWRCGGSVLAHAAYARQVQLKGEIIADAFGRIGRMPMAPPAVMASPERGYRMRARLHVRGHEIGFFREESHDLCDPAMTGQLLDATVDWLAAASELLRRERIGVSWLEVAEDVPGVERAAYFEVKEGEPPESLEALAALAGTEVEDVLRVGEGDAPVLRLRRDVRSFFQGNRYLLEPLVRHVVSLVPEGPVLDLYAGVGLFGLSLAAAGREAVTLVEGDRTSGSDLARNAAAFGDRVRVEKSSVEDFVQGRARRSPGADTVIVDPPRTGMSKEALGGVIRLAAPRIVYVSCDVATLARDARVLVDSGYGLESLTGIDLFPNTAHVESVALFVRREGALH